MLSNEPLPPGHRTPVAAVAAAALVAAGDAGLRMRACNALWPALRALGRVPVLRDVGTELSRVVYHEVFLSLQVRLFTGVRTYVVFFFLFVLRISTGGYDIMWCIWYGMVLLRIKYFFFLLFG